ncbi:MAG: hypothetical protein ACPGJV_08615 [Bacteriovoracaceae bacterium]
MESSYDEFLSHLESRSPWVLALYKETGISSFDLIRKLKKIIPRNLQRKIGHLGTLDPFADGIMLITGNGASRLQDFSHQYLYKKYLAQGVFGIKSNTGDCTGELSEGRKLNSIPQKENFEQELYRKFSPSYMQSTPMFSSAKHKGKNLYEYAREGIQIEKPPVRRWISSIEVSELGLEQMTFSANVGGGTYIRQLFCDIADCLGADGHLSALKRTQIGNVHVQDIESCQFVDELRGFLVELDDLLPFNFSKVNTEQLKKLRNGHSVKIENIELSDSLAVPATSKYIWLFSDNESQKGPLCLAELTGKMAKPFINFAAG